MKRRTLGRMRDTASHVLPGAVTELMLRAWRRLYWWNRRRPRPGQARRLVQTLVASGLPFTVELGAARREGVPDWVTLDLNGNADIMHDLTKPLPFPDGSVDRVYSSHVLEHFTYPGQLLPLLRECHRVLRPEGIISAAVPNARLYLDAYFHPERFDRQRFCGYEVGLHYTSRIDVVNFVAYLGGEHKFLFDEENLPRVLEEAGFRNARLRAYDPAFDLPERQYESVYAEAVK
jgi:predicted SAM-dependent methyltransferase